jgi:hypothetical protein
MGYKEVFEKHEGKYSDKWSSYLDIYSDLLDDRCNKVENILEIGVQNGGSLEIWSEYLPNSKHIVGCDIDSKCSSLVFEDPRISVLVGDVNSETVVDYISKNFHNFDVIVDDGSHISSDIIKSFWIYFPLLKAGGLYIIEDLHASYWNDFEGGLGHPSSSMHFLKLIADLLNFEHWGIDVDHFELFKDFEYLGDSSDNSFLSSIYSIQFFNSVCVITKTDNNISGLGLRTGAGSKSLINEEAAQQFDTALAQPSQVENQFAKISHLRKKDQIEIISNLLDHKITSAQELKFMLLELESYKKENKELESSLSEASEKLEQIYRSKSWKLISWYRKIIRK